MKMFGVPIEWYDALPMIGAGTYLARMAVKGASPETGPLGIAIDNSLAPAFMLYHASAIAALGYLMR